MVIGSIGIAIFMFFYGLWRFNNLFHALVLIFSFPLVFLGLVNLLLFYKNTYAKDKPSYFAIGFSLFGTGAIVSLFLFGSGQLLTTTGGGSTDIVTILPIIIPTIDWNLVFIIIILQNMIRQAEMNNMTYLWVSLIIGVIGITISLITAYYRVTGRIKLITIKKV
jgi:hypothetical protein